MDYYWYAGRSDDMFRVSGQWVSPTEVESALIEHNSVLEVAVVAYRESTELHTPKAFVVLREGVTPTSDLARELQEFVSSGSRHTNTRDMSNSSTSFRKPLLLWTGTNGSLVYSRNAVDSPANR